MRTTRAQIGILLAAVLLFPVTWYYALNVWTPPTRGFDLYPRWHGSHELLLHGRNPYGPDVSREIQLWIYGHEAGPGEDQQRFAYPPYVAFLLAPTVHANFSVVDRVFFWLLMALTAATIPLWARFVHWRPARLNMLLAVLLIMGSLVVTLGLQIRQLTLLVGFLVASAAALIAAGWLALGGAVLALATIKPQLLVLLLPTLFVWCIGHWKTRQRLFWSFLGCMAVLIAGSFVLLPTWPREFLHGLTSYVQYTDGRSTLQLIFGRLPGKLIALLLSVAVLWNAFRTRHAPATSPTFTKTFAISLGSAVLVIPHFSLYDHVLLIPALLIVVRDAQSIWRAGRFARLSLFAACALAAAQWILTAVLALMYFMNPNGNARQLWSLPLTVGVLFAPALLVVLSLAVSAPKGQNSLAQHVSAA